MPADTPTPLPPSALAAIEGRANAATPGPWAAGRADMATVVDGVDSKWIYDDRDQYVAVASGHIDGPWDAVMANARFIAHAREDIPALLAEVRRLTAEGERLRGALRTIAQSDDCGRCDLSGEGGTPCPSCLAFSVLPAADQAALTPTPLAATREEPSNAEALPWRCFHCGEVFTDEAAARVHFGADQTCDPGCLLAMRGGEHLLATIRDLEQRNRELLQRAQEAEYEAEGYSGLRAELKRYFGASDAWTCWNRMDEKQGRIEALEEQLAASRLDGEDTARLDALADYLVRFGLARLVRTVWEEGTTVSVNAEQSEPVARTHAALRATLDLLRATSPTDGGGR